MAEAVKRFGFSEDFKHRDVLVTKISENVFACQRYFPFIIKNGGINVLFIKGLTYWSKAYGLYAGVGSMDAEANCYANISGFLRKAAKELLEDSGFVVLVGQGDLYLGQFLRDELNFVDYLKTLGLTEEDNVLSTAGRQEETYLSNEALLLGQLPIKIFQKAS